MANEIMSPAQAKLAELKAAKGSETNALIVIPNHLAVCIDCSISMEIVFGKGNNSRLDAARSALRQLVSASDNRETAFSLVTFSSHAFLKVRATTSYAQLYTAELWAEGSTNMADGLLVALEAKPTRIILLSDGQPNQRPTEAVALAKERGVKIDTIAIGDSYDDDALMRWIADTTGGLFTRCSNPEDLADHFAQLEPSNYLQLEHK